MLEKSFNLKLQIRMNDFKAIEAAILKNKAYNEFDQLAQLARKHYPKTMLADYHMAQMYEKQGDNARALKSYLAAFQQSEVGDLTKDMMMERADEIKKSMPKKGKKRPRSNRRNTGRRSTGRSTKRNAYRNPYRREKSE